MREEKRREKWKNHKHNSTTILITIRTAPSTTTIAELAETQQEKEKPTQKITNKDK